MRFTNFILAAGLTASALAAPVAVQEQDDSCPIDVEPESTSITSVVPTTIPATTSPTIAPSSTQVVVTSSSAVVASSSASPAASSKAASSGKLQWIGANESGAEFGQGNIPGTEGTDYTFPSTSAIQTLIDGGMNIFRIPFLMERIAQGTMTASLDAAYVASIKTVVDYITAAGAHAILDAQNFGRYQGTVFTSTSDFGTFWKNVATEFADNDLVIFDCNNEFHDEPTNTIVAELNQACVSAVRSAGATSQYIFVEGTSYTGAWTWTSSGNAQYMANITDPNDKLVYEFHQYLDSDGSGTSATCVSSTIGAERVADATQWLKANNFKGILGEFAGGVNPTCETAVKGLLDALAADSEVWTGALWWGAGPWWGDYIFAMEPPSGSAYTAYFDTIASYVA